MPGPLGMIAGTAGDAILGLALQGQQDRRQLRQQEKLQQLEMAGQRQMTDYNMMKQMEMWRNTNYTAQMEQLRKAGLNPGLIYGMGGGGGQTTNIEAGKVTGASAPTGGNEISTMLGMGLQRELQKAQIENIKAATTKTQAETRAVDPAIAKTQQETINLKTQNAIAEIQKAFDADTLENRKSLVNLGLSKLIEETRIIENDREISDATKQDKIKTIWAQLQNTITDTLQKQKSIAKTDKEIEHIDQIIKNLQQQWDINSIDQQMAKDGMNPNAGSLLKLFHNMLRGIASTLGM